MGDKTYRITADMLFGAEEAQKLRDFCAKKVEEEQGAAKRIWVVREMMMLLAMECALRVSEIAALKMADLHLSNKIAYLIVWGSENRKVKKKRDVEISQEMVEHLKGFRVRKEQWGESVDPSSPLLAGRAGKRFTETALKLSWAKLLEEAGVRHRGISSARRTAIARMVSEKRELRWVMAQSGITSVSYIALHADIRPAANAEKQYGENHCWQFDIRKKNLQTDLDKACLSLDEVRCLRVSDFVFGAFDTERNPERKKEYADVITEIRQFIAENEWLGSNSLHPTIFGTARYKGILCGVVVMDMPNSFSKLLGEETRKMERLISRGACISFAPKNLGSSLLSWTLNWAVQNTRYRCFTAYSDPEALEIGTLYQACNAFYVGPAGTTKRYKLSNGKWVSSRYFRSRSAYVRSAKELGIEWKSEWRDGQRIRWELIPVEQANQIRQHADEVMHSCECREPMMKHKYAFIVGKDRRETRELIMQFVNLNPHLFIEVDDKKDADPHPDVNADIRKRVAAGETNVKWRRRLPYPKERGK